VVPKPLAKRQWQCASIVSNKIHSTFTITDIYIKQKVATVANQIYSLLEIKNRLLSQSPNLTHKGAA